MAGRGRNAHLQTDERCGFCTIGGLADGGHGVLDGDSFKVPGDGAPFAPLHRFRDTTMANTLRMCEAAMSPSGSPFAAYFCSCSTSIRI